MTINNSSYRGETGARVENLLNRDFTADRPWVKLGTDVTEFRVADDKGLRTFSWR